MPEAKVAEVLLLEAGRALKESRGVTHTLTRIPLFVALWLMLLLELACYIWVRIAVGAWELLRGRHIRAALSCATTREEWEAAAAELDAKQDKQRWRDTPASRLYDSELVLRLTSQLAQARSEPDTDVGNVCTALRAACVRNCGGIGNEQLYSHTFLGTKTAVQRFADETIAALQWLVSRKDASPDSPEGKEICELLQVAPRNFGRTALCLSGGGAMAFPHLGVVLELLQSGLHLLAFAPTKRQLLC